MAGLIPRLKPFSEEINKLKTVKISKDFYWEMSHRLPFHDGLCKNLHGHSYKMCLIIEGMQNETSMIIDYYDIARIVRPLIESLDHAFLCDDKDNLVIDFLKQNGFKLVVMQGYSTAENITEFILNRLAPEFECFKNITSISVKLFETVDACAERTLVFER